MGRSTLYEWAGRLEAQSEEPLPLRLADRPRPGRPAEKRRLLKKRLEALLQHKPHEYGYRYSDWTSELLMVQATSEGLQVGDSTVRRAPHELKLPLEARPRFILKRRSPTWR